MTELIKNKNTDKAEIRCEKTMKLLGWIDPIYTDCKFLELPYYIHSSKISFDIGITFPSVSVDFDTITLEVHRKPFYYFTCKEEDFKKFYKSYIGKEKKERY